jgi:hypothetical protein
MFSSLVCVGCILRRGGGGGGGGGGGSSSSSSSSSSNGIVLICKFALHFHVHALFVLRRPVMYRVLALRTCQEYGTNNFVLFTR